MAQSSIRTLHTKKSREAEDLRARAEKVEERDRAEKGNREAVKSQGLTGASGDPSF